MTDDYKDLDWAVELAYTALHVERSDMRKRDDDPEWHFQFRDWQARAAARFVVAALAEPLRQSMRADSLLLTSQANGQLADSYFECMKDRDQRIEELEAALRSAISRCRENGFRCDPCDEAKGLLGTEAKP